MDQRIIDVIWSCFVMILLTLMFVWIVYISTNRKEEPKQLSETVSVEVTKVEK